MCGVYRTHHENSFFVLHIQSVKLVTCGPYHVTSKKVHLDLECKKVSFLITFQHLANMEVF